MLLQDIKVIDEGRYGLRIETANNGNIPPSICPGLGGWKKSNIKGVFWTNILGQKNCEFILNNIDKDFPYCDMEIDNNGKIIKVIPV